MNIFSFVAKHFFKKNIARTLYLWASQQQDPDL
jgi:hypothetical protein